MCYARTGSGEMIKPLCTHGQSAILQENLTPFPRMYVCPVF